MKLRPLPINERYWDGAEFERWTKEKLGGSWRSRARRLGLQTAYYYRLCKNERLPSVETYCRLLSCVDAEPGTWLQGVDS